MYIFGMGREDTCISLEWGGRIHVYLWNGEGGYMYIFGMGRGIVSIVFYLFVLDTSLSLPHIGGCFLGILFKCYTVILFVCIHEDIHFVYTLSYSVILPL